MNVVGRLTKNEIEESLGYLNKINEIQDSIYDLVEERARLERERIQWWRGIAEKYGLDIGNKNYTISHVLGIVEEIEREDPENENSSKQ